MNIRLSAHSEQLVKEHLANGAYHSPEEVIEHALDALAKKESAPAGDAQREAVRDMLDFIKKNRAHLEAGASVKDFIHEGHRV
jgi:Arc/MetJ-type ribon-helix-helix transcriptional regulator